MNVIIEVINTFAIILKRAKTTGNIIPLGRSSQDSGPLSQISGLLWRVYV